MRTKLIIISVILLGITLRIYEFGKIPAGIYVDEASHGYNAYSLLTTGKDEYGKQFPIFLRSFGTYASPLYSYLTIIPVALMDLNEISVRIVSLISGIALLVLTVIQFGMLMGLVVAIAPIFIFTSRAAFESNLGLAILLLGSVIAFRAQKHSRLLLIAFPLLTFSSYGYHAQRLTSVILILFFVYKYWKKINKNIIILSSVLALMVLIPIMTVSFTPGAYARLSGLGVEGPPLEKILSTARLYMAYLSPENLFSKPDPDPQRSLPDLSVFYWWMSIPFLFGIFVFFKESKWKDMTGQFFLVLLVTSPVLGALTRDYFSTIRVMPLFLPISWLIAIGLRKLIKFKFLYIALILISVLELYSSQVLLKYNKSSDWNYEYKSLFNSLKKYKNQNIVLDNTRSKPVYILEAFYDKTDPKILQSRFSENDLQDYYSKIHFENNFKLENIEYRPIFWKEDAYKDQILVADSLSISDQQITEHSLKLLENITGPDKKVKLRIFKTNPKEKCQNADFSLPELIKKCRGHLGYVFTDGPKPTSKPD